MEKFEKEVIALVKDIKDEYELPTKGKANLATFLTEKELSEELEDLSFLIATFDAHDHMPHIDFATGTITFGK